MSVTVEVKDEDQVRPPLDLRLGCRGFRAEVTADGVPTIQVDFILLINPRETEQIGEALKRLTEYFSEHIYLVKASGTAKRCFYCGSLALPEERNCDACGAPF